MSNNHTLQAKAKRLWLDGNNAGNGYAVGNDSDDINDLAYYIRGRCVLEAWTDTDVAVYVDDDGDMVIVADSYGPWAVRVGGAS